VLEKIKNEFNVEFWNPPMKDLRPVLTLISPEQTGFLTALNSSRISYEIASNSFQKVIDQEREEIQRNREFFGTKALNYNNYNTYADIVSGLKDLASDSRVTYESLGTTYENREIPSVTITNAGGSNKPVIYLECGIHSREWISTASCLWIANTLLTDSSNSALLDKYRFAIIPTLNADGYVYTWTTNRQWRKTRSPTSSAGCYGADPNRNWDASFCTQGASSNPCSDTYCGSKAFSEKETVAMSNFMSRNKGNIAAYYAIHSYSQLWMYPYGYTNSKPSNSAVLDANSAIAVAAIKAANGLTFDKGPIATTIYIASGSSIDWAYDSLGVSHSYALELRDKGQYGFVLPASQIPAACTETWAGIKASINAL